jgi:dynein heavy chain
VILTLPCTSALLPVQEVNEAFDELEEGNEEALKTEYDRQVGCAATGFQPVRLISSGFGPTGERHGAGCWMGLLSTVFDLFSFCLTQVTQLSGLIDLINGDLSKLDRKKLITLCTIDVHARDVLQRLIGECLLLSMSPA